MLCNMWPRAFKLSSLQEARRKKNRLSNEGIWAIRGLSIGSFAPLEC